MKITAVTIHNFRSLKEVKFNMEDYSLLIGQNNAGKTTIITALRMFYEHEGLRFAKERDFPKFETDDMESWIEIDFLTTDEEQLNLKEEYRTQNKNLKVRRYFYSEAEPDRVGARQSNIYAYENGELSSNLFYGAKNISQAKLGQVIYIPEISKTDDTLKLSGPSPFRDMVDFVMKKVISDSPSYNALEESFAEFNEKFKEESTKDGLSLTSLVDDINYDIENWKIKFGIEINPIKPEDIIKSLLTHYIQDINLDGKRVTLSSYGQGLQRHLIYTLIMLSAKYEDKKVGKKKDDFSPYFTLILFEEPEAFLHPTQQEYLNLSLQQLANVADGDQQVLITSHSPVFVCRNTTDLTSLIIVHKEEALSTIFQLTSPDLDDLFDSNLSMFRLFSDMLSDDKVDKKIKETIKRIGLGEEEADEIMKLEQESFKYFLWLDSERASSFFANHILICEGASEKVFLDYLFNNKWTNLTNSNIYVLDAMGKFNIHRYMNLFAKLGISHSVLIDGDKDKDIQAIVNNFIKENFNEFTRKLYSFEYDLEHFLGIKKPEKRKDLKPLNIMYNYHNNFIEQTKTEELRLVIESLL